MAAWAARCWSAPRPSFPAAKAAAIESPAPSLEARPGAWAAVSTNPSLIPFAGTPLTESLLLTGDVLASLRAGPVYLRAFLPDGRTLETRVWRKP